MDISELAQSMAYNCIKAQKKEFLPGTIITTYIEKRKQETISPEIARNRFYKALEEVRSAEAEMNRLLIEGGYVNGEFIDPPDCIYSFEDSVREYLHSHMD